MNSLLPLPYLLPLLAGIVYVFAALFLKRSSESGGEAWRTIRLCNYTAAVMFLPLTVLGGTIPSWGRLWEPAVVALLFVSGQVCTVLALKVGDVSIATPVMGIKIVLVALLTAAIFEEWPSAAILAAAILSSTAVALLNLTPSKNPRRVRLTVLIAGLAALSYALFDVHVQKFTPDWGTGRFLPLMMAFAGAFSTLLRPWTSKTPPLVKAPVWPWLACGAICLGAQAMLITCPIALWGQATTANVLFSARGMWSVLFVWLIGRWFGNQEYRLGPRVLGWRLAGAALMTAAVIVVLLNPVQPAVRPRDPAASSVGQLAPSDH